MHGRSAIVTAVMRRITCPYNVHEKATFNRHRRNPGTQTALPELPKLLQQRLGRRAHLPALQGQRRLAQRFLRDIEPTMIDPKQGPLRPPGRGEQQIAHSKPKLAPSNGAKRPEPIRRPSVLAVTK